MTNYTQLFVFAFVLYGTTVEPRLSDSRLSDSCLSVPSIIWNDVQKILKQVIPNCLACDPSFVV